MSEWVPVWGTVVVGLVLGSGLSWDLSPGLSGVSCSTLQPRSVEDRSSYHSCDCPTDTFPASS